MKILLYYKIDVKEYYFYIENDTNYNISIPDNNIFNHFIEKSEKILFFIMKF